MDALVGFRVSEVTEGRVHRESTVGLLIETVISASSWPILPSSKLKLVSADSWRLITRAINAVDLDSHAYRAFTDIPDSEMEITAMQMVTTMKLITFAWNVEDGRSSPTTLDPALLATRLTPDRVPSLLAFLGYVLFFPSLVGPASDYASYEALIDGSIFVFPPGTNEASRRAVKDNQKSLDGTSNGSPSAVPGEEDEDVQAVVSATKTASSRVRIPKRRKTVAYRKLVTGLVMLGLYSTFGSVWGYGRIIEEGAWWSGKSVFGKWIYVMRAGFTARTKYYALWSISEVSVVLGPGLIPSYPDSRLSSSYSRARAFLLGSVSMGTPPRLRLPNCGTESKTLTFGTLRRLRVSKSCSIAGTAGLMWVLRENGGLPSG